jgi:hypothetical protein
VDPSSLQAGEALVTIRTPALSTTVPPLGGPGAEQATDAKIGIVRAHQAARVISGIRLLIVRSGTRLGRVRSYTLRSALSNKPLLLTPKK